jgi:hypothetical protein
MIVVPDSILSHSYVTSVWEQWFTVRGIFHVTWLILCHLYLPVVHFCINSPIWATGKEIFVVPALWCPFHTHVTKRSCWDTTDAAVESVHSGELWHWQFLRIWNGDIRKFWVWVLLACGKFYAPNTRFTTVIINKPTGHQRYVLE